MSKISELSQCLAGKFTITQSDADMFVRELFSVIKEYLETDKIVKVKGLGTFKLVEMNARETIDINTRERILIEGRNKISFTPENAVRNRINSPFAQFEAIEIDDDTIFEEIDSRYLVEEEPSAADETEEVPAPAEEEPVNSPVHEEPVAGTTETAEQEEEPAQKPETVVIDTSGCEDLMREGITHSRTIVRLLYAILILIAAGVIAVAGYFCYQVVTDNSGLHVAPAAAETEDNAAAAAEDNVATAPVDKDNTAVAGQGNKPLPEAATPDAPASEDDVQQSLYNKDPRVRTGAYVITGLDTIVTVQPGQTFKGICKAYLGSGMECYVEVFNNGMKDVKAGDKIKIPKVVSKKRLKRAARN